MDTAAAAALAAAPQSMVAAALVRIAVVRAVVAGWRGRIAVQEVAQVSSSFQKCELWQKKSTS